MTLLISLLLTVPPSSAERYVHADVLNVRMAPEETAQVTARLRIGARVTVLGAQGSWSRVTSHHGAEGWVTSGALGQEPLVLATLLEEAAHAKNADLIRALERAAALDGRRRATWVGLRQALSDAGKTAKAKRVGNFLAGRAPVHLAACRNGEWVLLARYSPGEGLQSLVAETVDLTAQPENPHGRQAKESTEALARELQGVAWFSNVQLAADDIDPRLKVVTEVESSRLSVSLGQCKLEDSVAATVPLALSDGHLSPSLVTGKKPWKLSVNRASNKPKEPVPDGQNSYEQRYDLVVNEGATLLELSVVVAHVGS